MNKPYIICHMMMSIDGRIDCGMTVKIPGSNEYYKTLNELDVPTTLSGKVTAKLEMAEPGKFEAKDSNNKVGKESFSKKRDAIGYQIVVDTKGSLLWRDDHESECPLLIITSEMASKEYLSYLDSLGISWIAVGKVHIDLNRAMEILYSEFKVKRMAVVGGGRINGAFLEANLLNEVSILLGPGIDGREGMTATFDGLKASKEPTKLKLMKVEAFDNSSVWLRYKI